MSNLGPDSNNTGKDHLLHPFCGEGSALQHTCTSILQLGTVGKLYQLEGLLNGWYPVSCSS